MVEWVCESQPGRPFLVSPFASVLTDEKSNLCCICFDRLLPFCGKQISGGKRPRHRRLVIGAVDVSPKIESLLPRGLRIQDAARYAGVSHWHLRTAIKVGKLTARRAGKVIVILREELDAFLSALPLVKA